MATTAPFPVDPVLSGIVLAYKNPGYIADLVLPRVPVGTKEFKYQAYNQADFYTVPETKVGRKGVPNEVEFTGTETPSLCYDFGLDDFVPQDDIDQAAASANGAKWDPLGRAVEGLTELIQLDREVRAAGLLFSSSSYVSGQYTTLSGTSQWSDFTNSNPVDAMLAALDIPLIRPNVATFGQATWTKLRQHPKVVAAVNALGGNAANGGVITRQQLAALLEVEEVLVGQSFANSAKPGQTATMARIWGKHAAFTYRNKNADTQRGLTWGFTAQYGTKIGAKLVEPKRGLRGGVTVRSGESVREVVCAPDTGYLFLNAVA